MQCLYICLYGAKSKCQLWPTGKSFFHLHKTEWVNMGYRIRNIEGYRNCIIGLKVTTILPMLFLLPLIQKTSNVGMWGVYPEAGDWNIALRTHI